MNHLKIKIMKYQFHKSSSSGSQVVPCGQTDMTKLIVAIRSFENAYKQQKQPARVTRP